MASGFTFDSWWAAMLVGLVSVGLGVGISWLILRGTALASRRIRLSTREPLRSLWDSIGWCGAPPSDQSRRFAIVAIVAMVGVWVVIPALIAVALAT